MITRPVYPALMRIVTAAFVVFTVMCVIGVMASYMRGTIHTG